MNDKGIVILEGADAAGKTRLATALIARYGGTYIHNGLYDDVWAAHLACVKKAVIAAEDQLVVIDRLWLSEQVYGMVYRGGPAYDHRAHALDRLLRRYGALTVLCVRKNIERHVAHFEELRTKRAEAFTGIGPVVRAYADLAMGDLTNTAKTYLGDLTRFGDYAQRDDVHLYDMTDFMGRVEDVPPILVGKLRGLARVRQDEPTINYSWILNEIVK